MSSLATLAELAAWTPEDVVVPLDDDTSELQRMLDEATSLIWDQVRGYCDTDDDDLPTDATIKAAFRDACIAQVVFWLDHGEHDDIEGQAGRQLSAGGVTWTASPALCERAYRRLRSVNAFAVGGVCVGAT